MNYDNLSIKQREQIIGYINDSKYDSKKETNKYVENTSLVQSLISFLKKYLIY